MFDWKKRTRAEQAHVIEEVLDETSAYDEALAGLYQVWCLSLEPSDELMEACRTMIMHLWDAGESALQQAIADSIKKQETYMQQLHMQEASEQQGENPDALLQSI